MKRKEKSNNTYYNTIKPVALIVQYLLMVMMSIEVSNNLSTATDKQIVPHILKWTKKEELDEYWNDEVQLTNEGYQTIKETRN